MTTRILQRVVMPTDGDFDVLPLYVDSGSARQRVENANRERLDQVLGRRCYRVEPHARSSFGTYFNAFPASYWRRWTIVTSVTLRLAVTGAGSVMVYRSTAKGDAQRVELWEFDTTTSPDERTCELSLEAFADGGWYWFDIVAAERGATLESAQWEIDVPEELDYRGSVTVGITTFNRPDDCLTVARTLARDEHLAEALDTVLVIDQGNNIVADHNEYAGLQKELGTKLTLKQQANLGGSGGFSRAMQETVAAGASDYVLLSDDDVRPEPESVLRAVTFSDLTRKPTIVGGHMFSLYQRSVLHAFGERVQPYRFKWGPAEQLAGIDFAERNLRARPELHRRMDVDYSGWWMCLIPVSVVRKIGLAAPYFIKWDDAEYGLRARSQGVPTVTLPGMAVWHVPWSEKDDTIDWQAYYHERNWLVTALLYSPFEHGGQVTHRSMTHQLKHLVSSQYSVAAQRIEALESVLAGPEHLHAELGQRLGWIRETRSQYVDAQVATEPDAFPPLPQETQLKGDPRPISQVGPIEMAKDAVIGTLRQFRRVDPSVREHPQAMVRAAEAKWFRLSQYDSMIVSTSDGTGASWYQRDPELFRSMLRRSLFLHKKLFEQWDDLAKYYRSAFAELVREPAWQPHFREDTSK